MAKTDETEWKARVDRARRALAAVLASREHYVAGGRSREAEAAAEIAHDALDLLAGNEDAAPFALARVRAMYAAREALALQEALASGAIESEIRTTLRLLSECTDEKTPAKIVERFVARMAPQLRALGIDPRRISRDSVMRILGEWRPKGEKRNTRQGELSTEGVIVELMMSAGLKSNAKRRDPKNIARDRLARARAKTKR